MPYCFGTDKTLAHKGHLREAGETFTVVGCGERVYAAMN